MADGRLSTVAIVGAATLKGREVAEVLSASNFPAKEVKLLDDEESLGQLEAVGEEMSFIQAASRDQFEGVDVAFFASDAQFTRRTWSRAREAGVMIVDLSYALEEEPGAIVRSPWVEQELGGGPRLYSGDIEVAGHPAATALALLLTRLGRKAAIELAVANIFEPASEQGRKGMDELHQQTVNLLSFQQMPKDVFGSQVAFNLLPRYGKESPAKLRDTQERILRHYRQITKRPASGREAVQHSVVAAAGAPARINDSGSAAAPEPQSRPASPSVALFQAPIFHSHVLSIFVELEHEVAINEIVQALAGEHVSIVGEEDDPPSNVSAAGEGAIQLAVNRDAVRSDGVWLWAAVDNLKLAAITAVACAESAIALRPKGRVQ